MNSTEKFKKYIRAPIAFDLIDIEGNTDTFHFKSLNMVQMALAVEVNNHIKKENGKTIMTKDAMKILAELMVSIIKESYPDIEDSVAQEFIANNLSQMQDLMDKLMPEPNKAKTQMLDKLNKELEDGKPS